MSDDVRLERLDHRGAGRAAQTGARDAAGVDLDRETACSGPADVRGTLLHALFVGEEDELDNSAALLGQLVEVGLGHARREQHRAADDLQAAGPIAGGTAASQDGQVAEQLWVWLVEWQAGQVQLAGRDDRRGASMEVGLHPADRALGRRKVAKPGVGVPVDKPGRQRQPARVDDRVGVRPAGPDFLDDAILDEDAVGVRQRLGQVTRDDLADVVDEGTYSLRRLSRSRQRPGEAPGHGPRVRRARRRMGG